MSLGLRRAFDVKLLLACVLVAAPGAAQADISAALKAEAAAPKAEVSAKGDTSARQADGRPMSLGEAIERARRNPVARVGREQRRAAEAQAAEARGARFPRVQVTAFAAPSPDIQCANADCTRTSPTEVQLDVAGVFGGVRLEAVQPLYTFGKIDAAIAAATHAIDVQGALGDAMLEDVALETARAYFGVGFAREIGAMLEDGAQQIEKGKQTLMARLERGEGEVTVQDRLRLETFEAEIRIRASQARERGAIALWGLRGLVGEPKADTEEGPFEPVNIELSLIEGYVKQARGARAEVRAARHGVLALSERTRMEQARWFPDLLLTGALGVTRATGVDDPPSAFANDPFNAPRAEIALLLRWSFDGGQWARVDRARADRERADAVSEVALAMAEFRVREAYQQAVEARARLDAARLGEKSARGWVASVAQADAVGAASTRDLADAYLAFFTLKSRTIESTYEWNFAIAALGRATGTLLSIFDHP